MAPGQEQCLTYVDGAFRSSTDDWAFIQESPVVSDQALSFEDTTRSVDNLLACLPQHPKLPSMPMFESQNIGHSEFWNTNTDLSYSMGLPVSDSHHLLDPTAVSVSAGPLLCDVACQLPCCSRGQAFSPSALSFNPSDVSPSSHPHSPLSVAESLPSFPQHGLPTYEQPTLGDNTRNSPQMMVVPHVSIAFSPPQGPVMGDQAALVDQLSLPPSSLLSSQLDLHHELGSVSATPGGRSRAKPSKRVYSTHSTAAAKPPTVLGKRHSISKGRSRQSPKADKSSRRFCHICRSAKELSKIVACCSGKQSHVFCSSCVARRLDLSFDELVQRDDWLCPKCLDECPCSKCRPRIRD